MMKKLILMPVLLLLLNIPVFSQNASSEATYAMVNDTEMAAFSWETETYNFGEIAKDVPVSAVFKFRNTGKEALLISEVKTSCGCTASDYSRQPIAPGAEGYVKATYNAAKEGVFHKTITITANTADGPIKLNIKGEVVTSK